MLPVCITVHKNVVCRHNYFGPNSFDACLPKQALVTGLICTGPYTTVKQYTVNSVYLYCTDIACGGTVKRNHFKTKGRTPLVTDPTKANSTLLQNLTWLFL